MRSARGVGGTARKTAKLGAILDQVHTQLVTERTKGTCTSIQWHTIIIIQHWKLMTFSPNFFPIVHCTEILAMYVHQFYCDDPYQILYSLKVTFVLISHHGGAGKESPKPLRFLERIEKPVPRPPTPIVPCPSPGSEEEELAIVLLQRVIRGRAIQTKVRKITNKL